MAFMRSWVRSPSAPPGKQEGLTVRLTLFPCRGLRLRLSENAHLPFDKLMALSKIEGLRYPHPSSLRRTSMYASFLGISEALHMDIFHQPLGSRFFESLNSTIFLTLFLLDGEIPILRPVARD